MALSPRQRELYTDRVNIWQKVDINDSQGTPQPTTYQKIYSNIPCKYEFTINVDAATDVGGFKQKSMFTMDILHLPLEDDLNRTLAITNGMYFVNVTPNNANAGTVSIGQGGANILPGFGVRSGLNKQIVQIMTEEHPPAEVLT